MANDPAGKMGLQILQTILVAVLLGATSWLAMSTVATRESLIEVRAKMKGHEDVDAEREKAQDAIAKKLDRVFDTQQQVLRDEITLQQWDRRSQDEHKDYDARIKALEKALEKGRP